MPRLNRNALSAAQIKRREMEPGVYADGAGLALKVDPLGNKRWIQRLTVDGIRRSMGLGSYPGVSLDEARKLAARNYRLTKEGSDPIEARRARRQQARAPQVPTLQEAAESFINLRAKARKVSPPVQHDWQRVMEIYVYPSLGRHLLYAIDSADIVTLLEGMHTVPHQARRVRHRLRSIFDYAEGRGWVKANPVSQATKALDAVGIDPAPATHHEALPYEQVAGAIVALRSAAVDPEKALALEFLTLTASRVRETFEAVWREIDLDEALWVIPAARMKTRAEHRVPLPRRAVEILLEAQRLPGASNDPDSPVFPTAKGKHIAARTANKVIQGRLGLEGREGRPATAHGLRSTFRDWTLEVEGADWAVAEAALSHRLGNSVEQAYVRTDLLGRRRALMESWAEYCAAQA